MRSKLSPVSVSLTFTVIWRHPDGVAHGTYSAPSFAEAVHQWESETNDCELIGVFAGKQQPMFWRES